MSKIEAAHGNGVVNRLLSLRHSLPLTIALHLLPGVPIVAAYLGIASPVVDMLGLPPYLGWVIAMCLGLAPVQLGLLFFLGHRKTGRFSLREVVLYRDRPTKRGRLIGLILALIVGVFVASILLAPIDTAVYKTLFFWIPFENTGGGGGFVSGYPRQTVIVTLAVCVVLTGVLLPIVEELYFRGFLLPRISHLGRWAPVLNATLFSLYHFWTPWQLVSRIGYFLPTVWATWRKKDLRISIWVHCCANSVLQLAVLTAIILGYA